MAAYTQVEYTILHHYRMAEWVVACGIYLQEQGRHMLHIRLLYLVLRWRWRVNESSPYLVGGGQPD